MAGRSLAGLVAEARERLVNERSVGEWFTEQHSEYPDTSVWATFTGWLADEIVRLAGCGVYRTDWGPWLVGDSPVPLGDVVYPYWDDFLYLLPGCPDWMNFREVCGLAERIDSFLATLDRGGPGSALARGCRQDLDGLAVLADWCEENGLPAAAAEARHVHGLVRRALS